MTTTDLALPEVRAQLELAGVIDWKGLNTEILLQMTEEQIESLGSYLGASNSAARFAIGDWLNFVEKRFSERYSQMQHLTGLSYSTLRSYASVSASIARVRRRTPEVSWTHHEAVATLPPRQQRSWLERIHREGWTVEETRQKRREYDEAEEEAADNSESRERTPAVREAAREVWITSAKHGQMYHVPVEPMLRLARSLGEPV
jgi:hypothetical protein